MEPETTTAFHNGQRQMLAHVLEKLKERGDRLTPMQALPLSALTASLLREYGALLGEK